LVESDLPWVRSGAVHVDRARYGYDEAASANGSIVSLQVVQNGSQELVRC
jgi:hypothetical protein